MRSLVALLVAGAGIFGAGGGCGTTPSRYDEVERWQCFEGSSGCDCFGTPTDATLEDPRPRVVSCGGALSCCFVQRRSDGVYECSCRAAPLRSNGAGGEGGESTVDDPKLACHAAALDEGSTEVVPRCPPVALNDSSVCALAFESCAPAYLEQNGLIACCEGTSCREDQYGADVCWPD